MPILKISEQLTKLSIEKIRIPADVDTTQDNAPCPQCGIPYDGEVCENCGFIAPKTQEAFQLYRQQQAEDAKAPKKATVESSCPSCGKAYDGLGCEACGHLQPPRELMHPKDQRPEGADRIIGRDPNLEFREWNNPNNPSSKKKKKNKKKKAAAVAPDNLHDVQTAIPTRLNEAEQSVKEVQSEEDSNNDKQGARMSRFDDELTPKEAAVPGVQYDQTTNMYLDGPFGLSSQSPAPEVDAWKDIYPERFLDVQDLDASGTDVMGGPGSNAVHADDWDKEMVSPQVSGTPAGFEQPGLHPMNASVHEAVNADAGEENDAEEMTEKEAAKKSYCSGPGCKIPACDGKMEKDASITYEGIEETLYKAYEASRDLRTAIKNDEEADFTVLKERLANVVTELQDNKKTAGREKIGAAKYLTKFASEIDDQYEEADITSKEARKALKEIEATLSSLSKIGTNGNQETDTMDVVQDLDGNNPVWDRQKTMTPDQKTNVLVPNEQPNQLALADTPDDYNDGGETGYGLAYNYHREPWPNDGTNPALVPFQQMTAAVQAGKEKILEAIEVVDRLERLGMVHDEDRANHIAKFEQMSDAKLAGFKASIDMLEESGARQPRSQKVASGANRLPEMGRLTTASTASPQDVKIDDFLMTL